MASAFQSVFWLGNQSFRLRLLAPEEQESFNSFLESSPTGNVFQTYQWGELKKAYGWQPVRLVMESKGRIVGAATILNRSFAGMKVFYSPRGPVFDGADYTKLLALFCRGVSSLARGEKAAFWRFDPELPAAGPGWGPVSGNLRRSPADNPFGGIQPRWVWRIPLLKSPEEQWRLLKKGARRQINKARQAGVQVREGNASDLPVFYQLLGETARRNKFLLRGPGYYDLMWQHLAAPPFSTRMMLACVDGEPVATALAVGFGRGVWDIYAGNASTNRDLGASYLLTWELLRWGCQQGYEFYDLGGIVPGLDDSHPLAGLRIFKSRFGGEEVEFVGEHDLVLRPVPYRLWHLGQKCFKLSAGLKKAVQLSGKTG